MESGPALHEDGHQDTDARQPRSTSEVGPELGGMAQVDGIVHNPARDVPAGQEVERLGGETSEVAARDGGGEEAQVLEAVGGGALGADDQSFGLRAGIRFPACGRCGQRVRGGGSLTALSKVWSFAIPSA